MAASTSQSHQSQHVATSALEDDTSPVSTDWQGQSEADAQWLKHNILSLALEKLMEHIAEIEEDSTQTWNSFSPEKFPRNVSQIITDEERQNTNRNIYDDEEALRALPSSKRYLPCHYFDHICGSSTGALIAIMLGRFRMTVPDCKAEYKVLGDKVFGKPRIFFTLRTLVGDRHKYNAKRLEDMFIDVSKRRDEEPEGWYGKITFPLRRDLCTTFVTTRSKTTDEKSDQLYLIRSYDHEKRSTPQVSKQPSRSNTDMSQFSNRQRRARCTGSHGSTPIFRALENIQYFWGAEDCIEFTDGGFGAENNPVKEAKQEIESLYGPESVGILVSVGTARKTTPERAKSFLTTMPTQGRNMASKATNPESAHKDMLEETNRDEAFPYYRLNHPGGLELELDAWEPKQSKFRSKNQSGSQTIDAIENAFGHWARKVDTHRMLEECASGLVERRRKRMKTARWERYATGASYECREQRCTKVCYDRKQFKRHLSERIMVLNLKILVSLATFPYYRIFRGNTLKPIQLIASYTGQPNQIKKILYHLNHWQARKIAELQFISIACAILAAATIGSFSWNAVIDAYWLAAAFWYSSLILSILGILLSAQQITVFQLLGKPPNDLKDRDSTIKSIRRFLPLILSEVSPSRTYAETANDLGEIGRWRPRWKMVFIWQCPVMFMSYSVSLFMAGLTIFVCTPLIRFEGWTTGANIAVFYLVTVALTGPIFAFASFWIYHYVDLEHDFDETDEHPTEVSTQTM
ncbi:uncharacterized protein KY384_002978 [Bacidia gigantensis]|uniref:uncharacterized protein n=1 Tax=Bacidia gigantensis TaxID=2732470 RepID=UPI001D036A55|nr:uncharacterized protein KY384_002978 [Bacidia gigantensis]KAG8531349.1 hypothetical protein KY384_002978 [Bacidia gigantensis]